MVSRAGSSWAGSLFTPVGLTCNRSGLTSNWHVSLSGPKTALSNIIRNSARQGEVQFDGEPCRFIVGGGSSLFCDTLRPPPIPRETPEFPNRCRLFGTQLGADRVADRAVQTDGMGDGMRTFGVVRVVWRAERAFRKRGVRIGIHSALLHCRPPRALSYGSCC